MILKADMKPGDRLPSEAELAHRFQVGRQSVREALRILEFSGIISVQKGGRSSGAVVQGALLDTISALFVDAFDFEEIPWDHLTVARLEIEKRVILHAVTHAGEKDFQALESNLEEARARVARNEPATEENIRFHQLLAQASGNRVFVVVVNTLLAVLRECLGRLYLKLSEGNDQGGINEAIYRSRKVITYHEDILLAMRNRDHEGAEALMEEHMVDLRNRILALEIR